jgi:hypothetical protein
MFPFPRRFFSILPLLGAMLSPVPAFCAENDPFFYTLEGELLGGYSQIESHDGEGSIISSWLASPNWKLSDKLYSINVYNGSYNRSAQVVAQEEGGRQTLKTQTHNVSTSLKYFLNDSWSIRPVFFANWIFVNEISGEDLGDGLYDYEEIGGGIESAWTLNNSKERKDELRFGFRYIDREYPNYQSLLSQFDPTIALETNEKDLDGYKFNLTYDSRAQSDWSRGLEGIFFVKDYTDKRTLNENGSLVPDETREDFAEYVNAYVMHPLGAGWTFRLDGQFVANQSNLDFYDTRGTPAPAFQDDTFVKDYFDYFSFLAKPSFIYAHAMGEDKKLVGTVDYSFYSLHYTGRKTQDAAGTYQSEDQQDYVHTVSGKLSVPVTKNLSWVSFASYTIAESNQDFENFYLYSYDLWTAVSGISLKF